jgi:hypothetical protein
MAQDLLLGVGQDVWNRDSVPFMRWLDELDRRGWIGPILSALFVAVMWWPWIFPIILAIYRDPNAAPWAQAIGSLFAVCVAIWFSRSDARERRIDRNRRAAAYAAFLTPAVASVHIYLERIDNSGIINDFGLTEAMHNKANAIGLFSSPFLGKPKRYGDFSSLDVGIAQSVVALLTVSNDINQYVKQALQLARSFDGNQRAAYVSDMDRKILLLRKTVASLQERLNRLMDQSAEDGLSD